METIGMSGPVRPQMRSAQKRRIGRLIEVLQSPGDRTLSQIGIARDGIDPFAHAEAAGR